MPIHANSISSYHALDATSITGRIYQVYANTTYPMTDRQMAECLGYADMNIVRPKITCLIKHKRCVEVGDIWDENTERMVRLVTTASLVPS